MAITTSIDYVVCREINICLVCRGKSMSNRVLLAILILGSVVFSYAEQANAQRGRCSINQGFRILGGGQASGYHWRTPGPCVNYYNPYSYHNTNLRIGGLPQGAGSYVARYGIDSAYHELQPAFDRPLGMSQIDFVPGIAPGDNTVNAELDEASPPRENSDSEDAADDNTNDRHPARTNGGQPDSNLDDTQESSSDLAPGESEGDRSFETNMFNFSGSDKSELQKLKYERIRPRQNLTGKSHNIPTARLAKLR
jgi:hypothetical protein